MEKSYKLNQFRELLKPMATLFLILVLLGSSAIAQNTYLNEIFNSNPQLSATQVSGKWYVDRYAPAAFVSDNSLGSNVLKISIDGTNDGLANRPSGYGFTFYNTQGRKFDQNGLNATVLKGSLYLPADWATNHRRSNIWATAFDASNNAASYPIMGFRNIDGASPSFSYWDDVNGWVNFATPTSYDTWYNFEIRIVGNNVNYYMNGNLVGTISAYGGINIGNVIMQAYNFNDASLGTAYDGNSSTNSYGAYWDNIITQSSVYNETQNTYAATIQEAIDAANANDVINVYPGTYNETAPNSSFNGATYQFGLFFSSAKSNITVQGVKADGIPITNTADIAAFITTNATNVFGYAGTLVAGNNITLRGLQFGSNAAGDDKAIEVVGNGFTFDACRITANAPVYIGDYNYNTNGTPSDFSDDVSSIQSYTISNCHFAGSTSTGGVYIANGAGWTGSNTASLSGRSITGCTFDGMTTLGFAGLSPGSAWLNYPVGAATVTGNTFTNAAYTRYIQSWGVVQAQFPYASYFNDNTFPKKVITTTDGNANNVRGYDASSKFLNLKRIGTVIQPRIDYALAGDVILVGAGTYAENVDITKSVELRGANYGTSGCTTRVAESVIQGSFTIGTDNITVDGFEFTGANAQIASTSGATVRSNITIKNNYLHATTAQIPIRHGLGMGGGIGSTNWIVSNNKIEDIQFANATAIAVFNVTNATINNNCITHTNAAYAGRRGINADGLQTATINGNIINLGGDPTTNVNGNWLIQVSMSDREAQNITIDGNTISNAYFGITTLSQRSVTGLTITNNAIGPVSSGVTLNTGSASPVIAQQLQSNITITNNSISTVTPSISGAIGAAVRLRNQHETHANGPVGFSNVTVNNNVFSVPTNDAAVINNNASYSLNATCNWYGTTSASAVAAKITGNVNFLPFSTSASPMNCLGVGPVTNITQSTSYMTIQAAIDAANANDEIHVAAGTYNETVAMGSMALTLKGANYGVAGSGSRYAESVVTGGFVLNSSANVTIDGFSVTGSNVAGSRGILLGNTSVVPGPVTLSNNILENWNTCISLAGGATPAWVSDVTVSSNLIRNNTAGIGSTENVAGLTVSNNTFSGNAEGIGLGAGLTGLNITGNTFASSNSSHIAAYAAGLMPSYTTLFSTNTFGNAAAVSATTGADWTTQSIYNTISGGISNAAVGATILVTAGTYNENVTVDKRITLDGAGSGTSGTVISVSSGSAITVTGSGSDASSRLIIKDVRVTGGASSGIYVTNATSSSFLTFDNVYALSNEYGISFAGTGTVTDAIISNSFLSNNNNNGLRIASACPSFTGLSVSDCEMNSNGWQAFSYNASSSNNVGTDFNFTDCSFTNNCSSNANSAGLHDLSFYGFKGNATLTNITVVANHTANGHGVVFTPQTLTAPAGNITINGMTISGSVPKSGLYFGTYTDLSNVSLNNVDVSSVSAGNRSGWAGTPQFLVESASSSSLNIGNTTLKTLGVWSSSNVDATSAIFKHITSGTTLDRSTLADCYQIEDQIGHATDALGLGFVRVKADNVYVTPASASIQRGINAATAVNTVNVAVGTYPESLTIGKSLTILGPNATQTPNSGTRAAEAILAPTTGADAITASANGITVVFKGFKLDMSSAASTSQMFYSATSNSTWTFEHNLYTGYQGEGYAQWWITGSHTNFNFNLWDCYFTGNANSNGILMDAPNYTPHVSILDNVWLDNFGYVLNLNSVHGTISGNTVTNTTVPASDYSGGFILASPNTDVVIQNNTFEKLNRPGILTYPSTSFAGTLTATGNMFKDLATGNRGAFYVGTGSTVSGITLNNNSFINNDLNVKNYIATSFDASCNWWGTAVPSEVAAKISGAVTYVPFKISDGGACSGYPVIVTHALGGTHGYATIQSAIDAATTLNNDIVTAAAGTYSEIVNITKAITLNGPNATIAGNGSRVPEAVIQFPVGAADETGLIYVGTNLSGVTIAGFDLKCQDATITSGLFGHYLILTEKVNNLTIRNNRMYSSVIPMYILTDNSMTDYRTGLMVEGNYVDCGPNVNSPYNRGIYVQATSGTIQDNQFLNTNTGIQYMPYGHTTPATIQRNTITAGSVGLYNNYQTNGAAQVTWSQNEVSVAPNDRAGLKAQVYGAWTQQLTFRGMEARTFGTQGSGSAPQANFNNNKIDANIGSSPYYTSTIGYRTYDASATGITTLTDNSFTNLNMGVVNNSSVSVAATCNWWGTTVAAAIAAGITGNVTYSPWLNNGTDNQPSTPGFQPVPGSCTGSAVEATLNYKIDAGCPGTNTGSIYINVSGGSGSYTYFWTPGSYTTKNITGIPAGTYNIVVTDVINSSTVTLASAVVVGNTFTAPAVSNPGPKTASTVSNTCAGTATYTATPSGTPLPTLSYSFSGVTTATGSGTGSGATFNKGVTNVVVTASNGCSTPATASFTVTVSDNQNPVITCTANQTRSPLASGNTYTAVGSEFNPTFSDNCPGTGIAYVLSGATTGTGTTLAGKIFNAGTTTVQWTATDASSNAVSCSFDVIVLLKIYGTIKYANNAQTPLNGVIVTLKNTTGGATVGTWNTSDPGHSGIYEFTGMPAGNYYLEVSSANSGGTFTTWGGVNATDYLLEQRHSSGVAPLSTSPAVRKIAGDVISPTTPPAILIADANTVKAAYIAGNPNSFQIPRWVFSAANAVSPVTGLTNIAFSTNNVVVNIIGACAGDVDFSYLPPSGNKITQRPNLDVISRGKIAATSREIEIPVRAESNMQMGAISLILDFDASKFDITGISMPNQGNEAPFFVTDQNILRIGWASLQTVAVAQGETILTIHAIAKGKNAEDLHFTLNSNPLSEIAAVDGLVYKDALVSIAEIGGTTTDLFSVYPNPARDVLNIEYTMDKNGSFRAEIYNIEGQLVSTTENNTRIAGSYKEKISLNNLSAGVYTLRVYTGSTSNNQKIIITK
ncbi:MAG: T9SS type A sorting domain-containing protein [Bacteroidales bacterium]